MRHHRLLWVVLGLSLLLMLAACGGGSGGDDSGSSDAGGDTGTPERGLHADAGADRDVLTGTAVRLDGSRSRADGDAAIGYAWQLAARPAGSSATLSQSRSPTPQFTADVDGRYTATLVIEAAGRESEPDRVTVTATRGNTRPWADAGADQNVTTGTSVTLDGRASSDADGDDLTYRWTLKTRPAGSRATLIDAASRRSSFVADLAGRYVASLVVSDGTVSSRADEVVITAALGNSAPVANAGDDHEVAAGDTAELDGRASSDADGDALNYRWRVVSRPDGSAAALANPNSVQPSLTVDVVGDYVVALVVDDGQAQSAADQTVVHAGPVLALFLYDSKTESYMRVPNQVLSKVTVEEGVGDQTITNLEVGRFILQAVGRDYTVQGVSTDIIATPDGRSLELNLRGLEAGVIPAGSNVQFTTNASSVTGRGVYDFGFTFTVAETGRRYRLAYQLDIQ